MPITKTKDRTADVFKAVKALTQRQVLVGVPADGAGRSPEPGETQPANNALIGYRLEYGDPEANLPPRPHLVPGVESVRSTIGARLEATGEKALIGDFSAIEKGLNAVGLVAQNAVRATITDGSFAPLAPRTLAQRKARGRKGEKPLVDTGQYRRAQTYVIRDRNA